ncbi:MAG: nucleotide exchange factor GrpE [Planctomycetia bacterium]|nr:nucleotide exchange factor GrpE [Planctomycetia bacterium]
MNTDSFELYRVFCSTFDGQWRNDRSVANVLRNQYVEIISVMFFELATARRSRLLSTMISCCNEKFNAKNFIIDHMQFTIDHTQKAGVQKLYSYTALFLQGLVAACTEGLAGSVEVYDKYSVGGIAALLNQDRLTIEWLFDRLQQLDNCLGRILSPTISTFANAAGEEEKETVSKTKKEPEKKFLYHDPKLTSKLNELAEKREDSDSCWERKVEQLQRELQSIVELTQCELRTIGEIRDGIEYTFMDEARRQLISIFTLISETLEYHPREETQEGYRSLLESCEVFMEYTKQSLSMLGVSIINDLGKAFDPNRHKLVRGALPSRHSQVTKVLKIGFSYKGRVLEKSEVEIDNGSRIMFNRGERE